MLTVQFASLGGLQSARPREITLSENGCTERGAEATKRPKLLEGSVLITTTGIIVLQLNQHSFLRGWFSLSGGEKSHELARIKRIWE
jgi:hypothetical protein